MNRLLFLALVSVTLSALSPRVAATSFKRYPYPNYSFDYSKHVVPIAYSSAENTVELFNKVKLNPRVPMKGGGYYLDVPLDQTVFEEFEVDIEFTINSEIELSRHIMLFFSRNEPNPKDFFAYQLGYKTDYEGVGIFLFRHMSQDNKWYLMTMQNSGVSNMFKGSGKPETGLYSSNSCQVTIEQGSRLGIRVMFIRGKIRTEIMDNDDNTYRYCQEVDIQAQNWDKYYFGVTTKNGKNLNKQDMITDIDIHTILFSLFDEELMPIQKMLDAERYRLLMTRKSLLDVDTGKLIGDVSDLFSKGIAHEVKTAQRKNMVFINEDDSLNEVLFKHYETLKGYRFNLEKFNSQLEKEIRNEDEQYTHLLSAKQLVKNQRLLSQLFEQADSMRKDIVEICEGTRNTLTRIIESDPVEQSRETSSREQLQNQYAQLDKDLTKGLERLHSQIDRMQLDVKDSTKLIMDYKKAYEGTYAKIPIGQIEQTDKKPKRNQRNKPLDQAIIDKVRTGMLFLQDKLALEVYGNGLSTISMVIILAMLAALGYTFMRVQAVLNKSKTF